MQKIYLFALLCLSAVATMSAKELSFYREIANEEYQKLESGKEYTMNDALHMTDYGDGYCEFIYDPKIFLLSDVDSSELTVTASTLNEMWFQLCCGGSCQMSNTELTKTNLNIEANKYLATQFESQRCYDVEIDKIPEFNATLWAQYGDDENTRVQITLFMSAETNAISAIISDNDFRFVNGGIEYNIPTASNVIITDLSGKQVYNAQISGDGVISTASFTPGVYVYNINGGVNKNGKIYIR